MSEPHDAASVGEVGQVPMRPDGVAVGVLGPCLEPVMVLSTAHLNRETARQLEAGEDFGIEDVWRPRYGYGFLVGAVRAAHESGSVPDCLAQAGALAGACGATVLLFDCDADETDRLERFDW